MEMACAKVEKSLRRNVLLLAKPTRRHCIYFIFFFFGGRNLAHTAHAEVGALGFSVSEYQVLLFFLRLREKTKERRPVSLRIVQLVGRPLLTTITCLTAPQSSRVITRTQLAPSRFLGKVKNCW